MHQKQWLNVNDVDRATHSSHMGEHTCVGLKSHWLTDGYALRNYITMKNSHELPSSQSPGFFLPLFPKLRPVVLRREGCWRPLYLHSAFSFQCPRERRRVCAELLHSDPVACDCESRLYFVGGVAKESGLRDTHRNGREWPASGVQLESEFPGWAQSLPLSAPWSQGELSVIIRASITFKQLSY